MTSQVTSALARLGVPDQLAGGPLAVDELATRAGAAAGPLRRLLAAAAAYGLVSQDTAGRYTLTPDGELLRSDVDGSARALAIGFFGPPIWASFGRTADVVQDPVPVNPAAPGGVFAYYAAHPEEAAWFAQGMGRATRHPGVRAGQGRVPATGRGPHRGRRWRPGHPTRLPAPGRPGCHRGAAGPAGSAGRGAGYLAGTGVARRVELVPGDFLRDVPQGDLHVICHVLHNWADEHARTIIGNCARASQPGGGLMVIDQLLPDGPEPSVAHLMDLIMMMAVGGRERTRAEHEALLGPAGYTLVRDTPLTGVLPWRVLEFERT